MPASIKIPTIFSAVDKFSSTVNKMTSNLTSFQKKAAGLERVNTRLNKMKYYALGAAVGLGVAVNDANNFEKSMSNVATLVDTNSEDMNKMGDDVLEISKKIPKPVEELSSSLYDIRSAGIEASNAMSTLETSGKLAVAGLSSTEESTNILTSAMNAFKKEGLDSGQIADILFKTVKAGKTTISQLSQAFGANAAIVESAGIKLADFQAATAALTTTGTPASQAQNQIRAAVVALQKPTAEMEKIYKRLGVTSEKELIDREGSMVGAFEAINKAGKDMKLNLAKAWGGSEAKAAVTSLTGATKDAYLSTLDDMINGNEQLESAFNKQMTSNSSQLQIAKNNMQSLSIVVGTQLAPIITSLAQTFVPVIQSVAEFIKQNDYLINIVPILAGLLIAFKLTVWGVRAAVFAQNIAMGINAARVGAMSLAMKGNVVAQTAYKIAMALTTGTTWLATAATTAFGVALNLGLWPILAIIAAITAVILVIKNWSSITDWFGKKWERFTSWFSELWANVVGYFQEFDFKSFFMDIGKSIIQFMLTPITFILRLLSKLPGKIGDISGKALGFIDGGVDKIFGDSNNENKMLPSTTQASNESVSTSIKESRLNINIKDKGGNVESVDNQNEDIPVKLTPTLGY